VPVAVPAESAVFPALTYGTGRYGGIPNPGVVRSNRAEGTELSRAYDLDAGCAVSVVCPSGVTVERSAGSKVPLDGFERGALRLLVTDEVECTNAQGLRVLPSEQSGPRQHA